VTKYGNLAAVIDSSASVTVTVTPEVPILGAELWRVGYADQALGVLPSYQITIGPGQSMFVEFLVVPEPGTLSLLGASLASLLFYAWRSRSSRLRAIPSQQ
jgi:hypothetical protein